MSLLICSRNLMVSVIASDVVVLVVEDEQGRLEGSLYFFFNVCEMGNGKFYNLNFVFYIQFDG